jgi:hypothetical protein
VSCPYGAQAIAIVGAQENDGDRGGRYLCRRCWGELVRQRGPTGVASSGARVENVDCQGIDDEEVQQ